MPDLNVSHYSLHVGEMGVGFKVSVTKQLMKTHSPEEIFFNFSVLGRERRCLFLFIVIKIN